MDVVYALMKPELSEGRPEKSQQTPRVTSQGDTDDLGFGVGRHLDQGGQRAALSREVALKLEPDGQEGTSCG